MIARIGVPARVAWTEVRDERVDQQENARADTRNRVAQELGAKYVLQGSIEAIEDQQGREKIVFYQVDATLADIESNQKVWTGQHKIKKYIERPRMRLWAPATAARGNGAAARAVAPFPLRGHFPLSIGE